jgi:hypothetical protein
MSDYLESLNSIRSIANWCDLKATSGWSNRIVFPLSLAFILAVDSETPEVIKFYETVILATASASYLMIDVDNYSPAIQPYNSAVRYIDWFITTPFLALVIFEYARAKISDVDIIDRDFESWWFTLLPIIMVTAGYLALISKNQANAIFFFLLSWSALLILFYLIFQLSLRVDLDGLEIFFYAGWTLYGLAFLIPDYCVRSTAYNILDFFNKVVFSIYVTFLFVRC